jgi:hypothetical protein
MVGLPAGINEAALISALAIVVGVVAYSFLGSMIPTFSYSQYIFPIVAIALIAVGLHMDHALGDVIVGFGAAFGGATIKGALPSVST